MWKRREERRLKEGIEKRGMEKERVFKEGEEGMDKAYWGWGGGFFSLFWGGGGSGRTSRNVTMGKVS